VPLEKGRLVAPATLKTGNHSKKKPYLDSTCTINTSQIMCNRHKTTVNFNASFYILCTIGYHLLCITNS